MLFHVVVPRRKLAVADRPVDRNSVLCIGFEVEVAPTVALAPPDQRAAADLIAADPIEPLHLRVGRLPLIDPKGEVLLVEQGRPLERLVRLLHRARRMAAVQVFPRRLGGVDVVLDVLDVATALQEQYSKTLFGKLLRRPAARNAGTHHNRVVACRLHRGPLPSLWTLCLRSPWPGDPRQGFGNAQGD